MSRCPLCVGLRLCAVSAGEGETRMFCGLKGSWSVKSLVVLTGELGLNIKPRGLREKRSDPHPRLS